MLSKSAHLLISVGVLLVFAATAAASPKLDTTFGDAGIAHLARLGPPVDNQVSDMAVQNDGKLLLAVKPGNNDFPETAIRVMRLDAFGRPDSTFGASGVASIENRLNAEAEKIVVDGRKRIYVFGGRRGSGWFAARLLPSGAPDRRFGKRGVLTIRKSRFDSVLGINTVRDRLQIVDYRQSAIGGRRIVRILRLNDRGGLNKKFGSRGVLRIDVGGARRVDPTDVAFNGSDILVLSNDNSKPGVVARCRVTTVSVSRTSGTFGFSWNDLHWGPPGRRVQYCRSIDKSGVVNAVLANNGPGGDVGILKSSSSFTDPLLGTIWDIRELPDKSLVATGSKRGGVGAPALISLSYFLEPNASFGNSGVLELPMGRYTTHLVGNNESTYAFVGAFDDQWVVKLTN